jgi:hypothetical protein
MKMHRARLEMMINMLRRLRPDGETGFDLERWHCGTTACAVGHACVTPAFKDQGLHLHRNAHGKMTPAFDGEIGWDAVCEFFEIGDRNAEHLFSANRYISGGKTTSTEVADRIESFLAEHAEAA